MILTYCRAWYKSARLFRAVRPLPVGGLICHVMAMEEPEVVEMLKAYFVPTEIVEVTPKASRD